MSLSEVDVIWLWEATQQAPAAGQALAMLAAAFPAHVPDEPERLSLTRRDGLLCALHRQLAGNRLDAAADCPSCTAALEFSLDAAGLIADGVLDKADRTWQTDFDGVTLEYRLPDSTDLAVIATCADVPSARRTLLARCVVTATRDGAVLALDAIPEAALQAVAAQIDEHSAGADTTIALTCPDCGHTWDVALEIERFVWSQLDARARRLLHEVDALARAYGWREADILAMSATRRRYYLEMVTGA
jgi:hypothetical protein